MLDEEMDDMIRKAADQHHPPYNNTAWDKMELLLDKHLPQKKDRRRSIYFLFLFLLLGGGVLFTGYYFLGNKKRVPGTSGQNTVNEKPVVPTALPEQGQASTSGGDTPNKDLAALVMTDKHDAATKTEHGEHLSSQFSVRKGTARNSIKIIPANATANENESNKRSILQKNKNLPGDKSFINEIASIAATNPDGDNKAKDNAATVKVNSPKPVSKVAEQVIVKPSDEPKEKTILTAAKVPANSTEKKKNKHSILSNFGISFSAGPDISFVGANKPGKVTLTYGGGLSYTFAKRLTLQTGFYVAKKLYSADSANYHPSGSFWQYYPNMQDIEANCKVYEIPVALSYNFKQKGKHNWSAGVAVSSYLMKKETYDYQYKTAYGQAYSKSYSIENQNKHYFSVLTLSGGYHYDLSKRISIAAEPYFKLPLKGVGFGKVKLKGGGVMFTTTVKPFIRKK